MDKPTGSLERSAAAFLAGQDFVDPQRIYLGGHRDLTAPADW
jgi:hypothetical protein